MVFWLSSVSSPAFFMALALSIASRRMLRTATLASSPSLETSFASCLRRSSVGAGKFSRMVWPSSMGLMPTSLAMMALLMARSRVRSQGVMVRVRASLTATDATCWMGVGAP